METSTTAELKRQLDEVEFSIQALIDELQNPNRADQLICQKKNQILELQKQVKRLEDTKQRLPLLINNLQNQANKLRAQIQFRNSQTYALIKRMIKLQTKIQESNSE